MHRDTIDCIVKIYRSPHSANPLRDYSILKRTIRVKITVYTLVLAFLAPEPTRHTLPFLVLNLTRCNPYVMFYSPRSAPPPSARLQHTRTRWKMKRGHSIACKIYRVIRLNATDAYRDAVCIAHFHTLHAYIVPIT